MNIENVIGRTNTKYVFFTLKIIDIKKNIFYKIHNSYKYNTTTAPKF